MQVVRGFMPAAGLGEGTSATDPLSTAATRKNRTIHLRLFFTCWLIYSLHFATNTVRELYPALSLGDRLSFDVHEYAGLHPDIFELPGRGVFINNNPGASIVAAVPYALARPVIDRAVLRIQSARKIAGAAPPAFDSPWPMAQEFFRQSFERGFDIKFGLAAGCIQLMLMAPLSALSAVVMFAICHSRTGRLRLSLALALLYAFATPVFFRTATLNQNLLVSHCAFIAFALLWKPWAPESVRRPSFLIAGFLAGFAVLCDYSGLVVALFIAAYAWVVAARRDPLVRSVVPRWIETVAGIACGGIALAAYQWVCFGHPLYPAQHYMPDANFSEFGYRGMEWPALDLLWATAIDLRFGLFVSAPVLLLALYPAGWSAAARLLGRREICLMAAFIAAFFLFCSANQYGRMQFNSGVRHVVPTVPFLFLMTVGALMRLPPRLALVIGLLATYWSWCLAMYRDVERGWGVLECVIQVTLGGFRLPWLTTLERLGMPSADVFRHGSSAIPLFLLAAAMIWAIWRWAPEIRDA